MALPAARSWKARWTLIPEPLIAVGRHEVVVIQVGVGGINTINLLTLAGTESLVRVQAPDAFE